VFRPFPTLLLASVALLLLVPGSASAQPFLTFGGSFVSVARDVSEPDRLDSPGFGIEVGGALPVTAFMVVSGGVGLDSHGFTPSGRTIDVLARRLAVGIEAPGLYFNGEDSKAIFYVGADAGYEWLRDPLLKGSSYVEQHVRIFFSDAGGHLWGINVAWRTYGDGGSYRHRAIFGGTLMF